MKLLNATLEDFKNLQELSRESYLQNFGSHWEKNGLDLYLENEFGDKRLESDLRDPTIGYYFIVFKNQNVGFLKMNFRTSLRLSDLDNCELEKIYILPKYKGLGLGKLAIKAIVCEIVSRNKKSLFLSVIDTNTSAIAFYKKLGFIFHSKTRLEVPYFKEELRGMHRMVLNLRS
ncbi:GNAT family N-acetyltransferase [Aquimarina sp. 2201CG5-10]|uniref:GNAT family N-acetyltransferase n=1 Tax=Aquimarina callyspongiae TaxID=3098150 RepID=UPI002AB3312C|nr:GNAT family N-acetyltransferase [Aquimarina sp. 2201CG5-10]MDY8136005.1 GNAT family N-acetyltransferase [Aquimarina sp. 2201CG5-10]